MALTLSGTNGVVGAGFTVDASGVSVTAGVGTFSSVQGSGANLTSLPAANLTGTLPALNAASLTSIPAANLVGVCTSGLTKTGGFGKILQVVHATATSEVSQSFSAGDTFVDTGLSASITPSSSSNKIFVTGVVSFFADCSANGGFDWNFAICDSSNNILDGTTASLRGYFVNELYDLAGKHPINFLHSPSTTSSYTYKIRMNAKSSNVSGGLYAQVNGSGNNISRLTLIEVEA